ncbi:MAG: phosphoribosylformylglycinamidine cyclo-ligase [Candidatus Marinimicrobia bacterium]|nr:phosphoribosylformylglycinamidine cyclo-ligase [Candidatus Neomarinimicrobiota bacterium]
MGQTYKEAGVDISAGETAVKEIGNLARSTFTSNVLSNVGSFGAQFLFPVEEYQKPVLISSTDGVGTKTLVAAEAGKFDTIGEDLVNHCINDILSTGAKPLFFLDYVGVGNLVASTMKDIVSGMAKACRESGCSLIGGEMAEMPEIYGENRYDLVGTIVGVVERDKLIDGSKIEKNDLIIALRSSGLHTNGYTLARKVLLNEMTLDTYHDELGTSIGEELLNVHRSYLTPLRRLLEMNYVTGLAHITGGGIESNSSRVLPDGLSLKIDWNSWTPNAVFNLIQRIGNVPLADMRHTFNMGIGFTIICRKDNSDNVLNILEEMNETPVIIGEIV